MKEQEINEAKEQLKMATIDYSAASVNLANAKSELEIKKASGLASGLIEGKNAELREAVARDVLHGNYAQVDAMQAEYDKARLALDLAKIEDSRVSMLLRLLELSS